MKHIKTRYRGPSNTRGARVIASEPDGRRATISRGPGLDRPEDTHRKACIALCERMGWTGDLRGFELDPDTWLWFFDRPTLVTITPKEETPHD